LWLKGNGQEAKRGEALPSPDIKILAIPEISLLEKWEICLLFFEPEKGFAVIIYPLSIPGKIRHRRPSQHGYVRRRWWNSP